jgi:hypothetical protein
MPTEDAQTIEKTEASEVAVEPTETEGQPDYKALAEKWKTLSRKHEGQAKANADAAKRLAEMEDADKTEMQKLIDKAAASDKEAAHAQRELARLRVGMRKGLTETQAKRLVGETEEELEADADELLAAFRQGPTDEKDAPSRDNAPTRPKEKLKSGATGADTDALPQLTREDLKDMSPVEIEAARVEGRLNELQGIKVKQR